MNTLKIARGIAFLTTVASGVISAIILIAPAYALENNINDQMMIGTLWVFFTSTLYTMAINAVIQAEEAELEAVKKIYETTYKQSVVLMICSTLFLIVAFVFL